MLLSKKMKNSTTYPVMKVNFAVLVCLLLVFGSCGGQESVLEYNAKLSQQNDRVVEGVNTFFSTMENDDFEGAENARKQLIVICDSVVSDMQKIGGYEDDKQLLNVLVDYVELQKQMAQNEYKKLIEANITIDKINSATTEPDIDAIAEAYLQIDMYRDSIDYKDSLYYQKAIIVQKKFGLKHGFTLEEGDEE